MTSNNKVDLSCDTQISLIVHTSSVWLEPYPPMADVTSEGSAEVQSDQSHFLSQSMAE